MSTTFTSLFGAALILAAVQVVAAIPWLWALDPRSFRRIFRRPKKVEVADPVTGRIGGGGQVIAPLTLLGYLVGATLLLALAIARFMSERRITTVLEEYGRYYGAVLHAQLALDFLVMMPQALLLVWPKGGAVALSTFRECWRQPMFWLISLLAMLFIIVSMVIPYFT